MALLCVIVRCINASCNTSNTMWERRSPEGYINNTEQVWRLHCIWVEAERNFVRAWIFHSSFKEANLIPGAFFLNHIQSTAHEHKRRILNNTRQGDGGDNVNSYKDRLRALTIRKQMFFSTWMGDYSSDSCAAESMYGCQNHLSCKNVVHPIMPNSEKNKTKPWIPTMTESSHQSPRGSSVQLLRDPCFFHPLQAYSIYTQRFII